MSDTDDKPEWALVAPFLTDVPAFTWGVEYGIFYARMRRGDDIVTGHIHAENDERLIVLARRLGYAVEYLPAEDGWIPATFTRRPDAPAPEDLP